MSFLRSIFGKKESFGLVTGLMGGLARDYPDPSLADQLEYYKRDPTVRAAIDDLAERSVGMGFYTTAETGRAKSVIDRFCEDVNLDGLNLQVARECWGVGNSFLEYMFTNYAEEPVEGFGKLRVPAPDKSIGMPRLIGLKPLPVASFTKIHRNALGRVLAYEQTVGATQLMQPECLLHFRWNPVNESAFGVGLITTLASPGKGFVIDATTGTTAKRPSWLAMKERTENALNDFFIRYIGRYAFVWKGEDQEKVKEYFAAIKTLRENQDIGVGTSTGADFDIKTLSIDPRARFDTILPYFENRVLEGLETPINKLFTTPGFTEASAKAAVEISERKVAAFQRFLKRIIERDIFPRVLRQNGLNVEESKARLNWGMQETPSIDVENLLKLAEMSAQYGVQYIRPDEVRKSLAKLGVELWEPEQPEAGVQTPPKQGKPIEVGT